MRLVKIPRASQSPTDTIWHYTGSAGLLGIIQNNSLWASSPMILNDLSEIDYGEKLLKIVWENMEKDELDPRGVEYTNKLLDFNFHETFSPSVFLVSASSDSDSLNQWAHYSGETGFAIGLNPLSLITVEGIDISYPQFITMSNTMSRWYPVLYTEKEQIPAIKNLLNFFIDGGRSALNTSRESTSIDTARQLVQALIVQFKHHAFSAEKELRYVTAIENNEHLKFRTGNDRIIPFVTLSPCSTHYNGSKNFPMITDIRIGPNARPGTNSVIKSLLAANNLDEVRIHESQVPYLGTRG